MIMGKSVDVNGTRFDLQTKADIMALDEGIKAFETVEEILKGYVGKTINKRLTNKIKRELGLNFSLEYREIGGFFELKFYSNVVLSQQMGTYKLAVYPGVFRTTWVKLYVKDGKLENLESYKIEMDNYKEMLEIYKVTLDASRQERLAKKYEELKKLNNEFYKELKGNENQIYTGIDYIY